MAPNIPDNIIRAFQTACSLQDMQDMHIMPTNKKPTTGIENSIYVP
jgi:hypothetical protein